MVEDNGLILSRVRSGSVDDANVLESDHRGVHSDERLNTWSEAALGPERDCQERTTRELGFHSTDYLTDWYSNQNPCAPKALIRRGHGATARSNSPEQECLNCTYPITQHHSASLGITQTGLALESIWERVAEATESQEAGETAGESTGAGRPTIFAVIRRRSNSATLKEPCQPSMEIKRASTASEKASLLAESAARCYVRRSPPGLRYVRVAASCSPVAGCP